jgi:hypothetical protein
MTAPDPVPFLMVNYKGDRIVIDACLTTPEEVDRLMRILAANRELLRAVSEGSDG